MADEWVQGTYIPESKEKWVFPNGKYPTYRSSWELRFMNWISMSRNVVKASSEPFAIEYQDLSDKNRPVRRYFPDFFIEVVDVEGKSTKYVVEIKPSKQCPQYSPEGKLALPPKPKKQSQKAMANWQAKAKTLVMNHCKWQAAKAFCAKKGFVFKVITEKSVF